MSVETGLILGAIVVLLLISAILKGGEVALTGASRARLHALDEEGHARARLANRLLAEPEKLTGAVLLASTFADALAVALATGLAIARVGNVGVAYAAAILTPLAVIFSAVLPKTFALAWSDRVALLAAPVLRAAVVILAPLIATFAFVVRQVLRLTPSRKDDAANILAAREEIRGAIDLQQKEGAVARHDAEMLGGVLDLGDLQVQDIMIHRTKMDTINADDPARKVVDEVLKSQYSRVPIWKDQAENIVGILHTKDLLAALHRLDWNVDTLDILALAAQPWFVPDATSVRGQLNQFLKRKAQMALVVDEYGEVQGLITLEDILEEIVGQIADEHDTHETGIRPQADGTVNVDGAVAVRDLNRHMNWELPDEEATTIAGLVIHEAQVIPEPGRAFTFHGYRFEILRKSRNKITALRVQPVDRPKED
jgi:Mg2+/Co2+ transporter CorB